MKDGRMMGKSAALEQGLADFRRDFERLRTEIGKVVVGQDAVVFDVLCALVAGGHVLLAGDPGVGKTLLARTLADVLALDFRRIQCTPDLLPADVIGTYVVLEVEGRRKFEFQHGPIFSQVLLVDELNRATPKAQAALLEGMEEFAVSVANKTYDLPEPFFVIATQSCDDSDGTYPLPDTQLDRFFFRLPMPMPDEASLATILQRTTEPQMPSVEKVLTGERLLEMSALARQAIIADSLRAEVIRIVLATHPENQRATDQVRRYVRRGASARAAQTIVLAGKIRAILDGRANVAREDIRAAALPALRHRIGLSTEGVAAGVDSDELVRTLLDAEMA